ncbi:hypothetical protein FAI41_06585 [Acetobacteraceae bacterium]|nr:hypothetical protein FAI41_06585 [Acetobacteraceae bacterium]
MTDHFLTNVPNITEKMLRFADQAAENVPLCRTNLVCHIEFDLTGKEKPPLDAVRNLIKHNIATLPSLRHYLEEVEGNFHWRAYMPDLEKCITEKRIISKPLKDEIQDFLTCNLPYNAPWKLCYFPALPNNKFSLLWCVRHEIMDASGISAMLNILFGQKASAPFISPNLKEYPKSIPSQLLEGTSSNEEVQLFFKNIPSTPNRQIISLQMPASLLPNIGKVFGVSGNDLYLKAMGDALWQWRHAYTDNVPKEAKLPLIMPINLRPPADLGVGNRFYLGRIDLPPHFSLETISKKMDIFRQKNMKEDLIARYAENPNIAVEQLPPSECLSVPCSSFRITQKMAWDHFPLKRIVFAFNAFVQGMPFYSILSTYAPKHTDQKDSVSTLFCSLDAGIQNFSKIPELWKKAVYELVKEANIDLSAFGEDPIQVFC